MILMTVLTLGLICAFPRAAARFFTFLIKIPYYILVIPVAVVGSGIAELFRKIFKKY